MLCGSCRESPAYKNVVIARSVFGDVPDILTLLLTIDVGNTHITLGAFDGERLMHTWRLRTDRRATADELGLQIHGLLRLADLEPGSFKGVCIASVVPMLDGALIAASK